VQLNISGTGFRSFWCVFSSTAPLEKFGDKHQKTPNMLHFMLHFEMLQH